MDKILNQNLKLEGIIRTTIELDDIVFQLAKDENYDQLDKKLLELTRKNALIYNFLRKYAKFSLIEHIISLRVPPDENGIWHDDGSRTLGFTIGLLESSNIKGGELKFRKKFEPDNEITLASPKPGEVTIFLTGVYDHEHMVTKVLNGKRLIMAGWCSE